MSGIATAIGATAVIGAYSANKASKAQQQSGREGMAAEREMFDISRQDQEPWRRQGESGLNRLAYMLGLDAGGGSSGSGAPSLTRDQLRNELVPQFTSRKTTGRPYTDQEIWSMGDSIGNETYSQYRQESSDVLDEAGLNAAIEARLAQQAQQAQAQQGAQQTAQGDPAYGSLLRDFSSADMEADPVYQSGLKFGLDEGIKGLNRIASASGGRDSGALLKGLTRFSNDYGSTKANESYNRFKLNQDGKYNKLASLSGIGQQTSAQMGSQALTTGQSMNNSLTNIGNSRAAGYIGASNSFNSAVGQGVNAWQTNELIKRYPLK
jgi:hypothetical protein